MEKKPLSFFAELLNEKVSSDVLVEGFSIDSRNVKKGDLFFALPGKKVDGASFLELSKEKGAAACIVGPSYPGTPPLPHIRVPDVLKALQTLAKKILSARKTPVIGVTGSLGKTTTKEFIASLLETKYKIAKSPLSYNSQATLPLNILNAEDELDYLVLEMGMSEPGEIKKLVEIAPPTYALITNVAFQHAIHFPEGLLDITKEKGEIFRDPKTKLKLFHHDIHHKNLLPQSLTFSITDREATYYLDEQWRLFFKGEKLCDVTLNLPVKAHYQNFLAAFAVCHQLDVPLENIIRVAPTLALPPMRFEKVVKGGIVFINDAYNANPDAMCAALASLPSPQLNGKTVAVLSEMDALGSFTQEGHALVAKSALKNVDALLCLGPLSKYMIEVWEKEKGQAPLYTTKQELIEGLKKIVKPGDVVLLKGARRYQLDEILNSF